MLSKAKISLGKIGKILLFSFQSYKEDQLYLQASALTLYSLLSIVPVLALAFAVAKGFGLQEILEKEILNALESHREVATHLIEFSQNLLNQAKGGVIAGVGVATLLWAVIKLLSNVEEAFNHIWGVTRGRTWVRRFSDYLSLALICPILLVVANGAMILLTKQADLLGRFSNIASLFLQVTPVFAMSLLLAFLYRFMPNTVVPLKAVAISGFIAGIAYILFQNLYLFFQIKIANYSPIYGSFAAFPLFLIWLQMSWLIILTGAEIAYSIQNIGAVEGEESLEESPEIDFKLVALASVNLIAQRFSQNQPPLNFQELSMRLQVPSRLLRKALSKLCKIKILVEVSYEENEIFLLTRDPQQMNLSSIWLEMEKAGNSHLGEVKSPEITTIEKGMVKAIQGFKPSTTTKL